MKAKKRNIGNTTTQAPIIIRDGGGGVGTGGIIVLVLAGASALYFGNRYLKKRAENKAEADTSPEATIANQLKVVFDKFPVSDADYRTVALQITNENQPKVRELYRKLTGRNLTDDIANHIGAGNQAKADKIKAYNSKPGRLFSITPDNKIKFEVVKGDLIRFAPGQTTPVTFYNNPFGIILNDVKDLKEYQPLLKKLKSNIKTV